MTKRDRVVLARILKVHDKARFRMERAEVTWAAELEKAFGGYVNDRDSVISRTLDRLVLTPEGGIAEGAQNEALVAEMAAELEAAAGTMFDAGGVFDNSLTGASKVAERIGIRRFRDVLASADRPLDPKELKLTRAARKRINAALDTTRSEYYQGNLLNLDRFRVTFLRHINDPATRSSRFWIPPAAGSRSPNRRIALRSMSFHGSRETSRNRGSPTATTGASHRRWISSSASGPPWGTRGRSRNTWRATATCSRSRSGTHATGATGDMGSPRFVRAAGATRFSWSPTGSRRTCATRCSPTRRTWHCSKSRRIKNSC